MTRRRICLSCTAVHSAGHFAKEILTMKNNASLLVAGVACGLIWSLATGVANAQAGADAWKAAKIYVPAALATAGACESDVNGSCVGAIKPGKHPVILYLHGCGGLRTPRTFLDHGAIVVAPNSFASGLACRPDPVHMGQVFTARQADATYAAAQLKNAAWADPDRLVLAGFSNGAQLTATYAGNEFKARIIVAWTCNNPRATWQNGVRGAEPALALLGTADAFYRNIGISGDCGAALSGRTNSRSILIKDSTHEILEHAETRAAVVEFVPNVIK